jgi:hypothetical protein
MTPCLPITCPLRALYVGQAPCHRHLGNWWEQSTWRPRRTSGHNQDTWQNVWSSRSSRRPSGHHCDTCHFEKTRWLWLWPGVGPIPVVMGRYGQFQGLALRGACLHHQDSYIIPVLWQANITINAPLRVCVWAWICRRKTKLHKKMPWAVTESSKQKNWVSFQAHNQILPEHARYSGSYGEGSWP